VSTGVCVTVDRAMSQEQFLRPPIPLRRGPSMDDLMAEWKSLDVNAPKAQGRDQAGAQPGGQYEFAYAGGNGGNNMSYFNYPPVNTSVGSTGSVTGRVSGTAYGTGAGFNNNQLGAGAIVDVDSQQGGAHAERNSAAARGEETAPSGSNAAISKPKWSGDSDSTGDRDRPDDSEAKRDGEGAGSDDDRKGGKKAGSGEDSKEFKEADDKKARRMLSNRESARRSRQRKQQHLDELQGQVSQLRAENLNILHRLAMVAQLTDNLTDENRRLRSEAASLTSRLTVFMPQNTNIQLQHPPMGAGNGPHHGPPLHGVHHNMGGMPGGDLQVIT